MQLQFIERPPQVEVLRRPVKLVSIDPPGSPDIDDGFLIEVTPDLQYRLQITITDVTQAIPFGSDPFRDALTKVATRYYPNRTLHMLPEAYATNLASLIQGQSRPGVTIDVTLSNPEDLEINIYLSEALNTAKLSYIDAEQINRQPGHPLYPQINHGLKAAHILKIFRENLGITVSGRHKMPISDSEAIIREMMIFSNIVFLNYFQLHKIPGIARVHDSMDERAYYSTALGYHTGLMTPIYGHGTSPLRRLSDLLLQYNLVAHLQGKPLPISEEFLQLLLPHINKTSQEISRKYDDERKSKERMRREYDEFSAAKSEMVSMNSSEFHSFITKAYACGYIDEEIETEFLSRVKEDKVGFRGCWFVLMTLPFRQRNSYHKNLIHKAVLEKLERNPKGIEDFMKRAELFYEWKIIHSAPEESEGCFCAKPVVIIDGKSFTASKTASSRMRAISLAYVEILKNYFAEGVESES